MKTKMIAILIVWSGCAQAAPSAEIVCGRSRESFEKAKREFDREAAQSFCSSESKEGREIARWNVTWSGLVTFQENGFFYLCSMANCGNKTR